MKELVILVNEHDQEVGIEEKLCAHKTGKLHRAFSIFIFNGKGQILLQQRALRKYHSGGLWTNACCSHPRPFQSIEHAAALRLKQEMGFECKLKKVFHFIYKAEFNNGLIENEFDHVFIGNYDGKVLASPNEVMDFKWVSLNEVVEDIKFFPEKYTVWFGKALRQGIKLKLFNYD